jgi:hypothetical protein
MAVLVGLPFTTKVPLQAAAAPFERLPNDFVFVRAREIPQELLARSLVDKPGKLRPLRAPPGV